MSPFLMLRTAHPRPRWGDTQFFSAATYCITKKKKQHIRRISKILKYSVLRLFVGIKQVPLSKYLQNKINQEKMKAQADLNIYCSHMQQVSFDLKQALTDL